MQIQQKNKRGYNVYFSKYDFFAGAWLKYIAYFAIIINISFLLDMSESKQPDDYPSDDDLDEQQAKKLLDDVDGDEEEAMDTGDSRKGTPSLSRRSPIVRRLPHRRLLPPPSNPLRPAAIHRRRAAIALEPPLHSPWPVMHLKASC
jgi:hypothetical protein